jgi:hypothetical protein
VLGKGGRSKLACVQFILDYNEFNTWSENRI